MEKIHNFLPSHMCIFYFCTCITCTIITYCNSLCPWIMSIQDAYCLIRRIQIHKSRMQIVYNMVQYIHFGVFEIKHSPMYSWALHYCSYCYARVALFVWRVHSQPTNYEAKVEPLESSSAFIFRTCASTLLYVRDWNVHSNAKCIFQRFV